MGKETFSISGVISTDGALRITLENKEMPGWFAELDLDASKVSQLIDQKYRIEKSPISSEIKDRSGFTKRPRKLQSN
ncbi:hypothetical protein KA005_00860 [bacterium]|nr:hypothetical protein [bacterium]